MYLNAKIEDYRAVGLDPVEDGGVSAEYLAWYDAAWAEERAENKRLYEAAVAALSNEPPSEPPAVLPF